MKKLKKMPKLSGNVPLFYSRDCIYTMCIAINALSNAVDYLAEKVEKLEELVGDK